MQSTISELSFVLGGRCLRITCKNSNKIRFKTKNPLYFDAAGGIFAAYLVVSELHSDVQLAESSVQESLHVSLSISLQCTT